MKRNFSIFIVLLFELLFSLTIQFVQVNRYLVLMLFILNAVLLFFLMIEPYWRVGAWLIYFINAEIFVYILNLIVFEKLLFYVGILNLTSILFGLLIAVLSFLIHLNDLKPDMAEPYSETEEIKEFKDLKKSNKNIEFFATTSGIIHNKDCRVLKNAKDTKLIASLDYAKSGNFKPCKICKPF